jgi:hypothetical protein
MEFQRSEPGPWEHQDHAMGVDLPEPEAAITSRRRASAISIEDAVFDGPTLFWIKAVEISDGHGRIISQAE